MAKPCPDNKPDNEELRLGQNLATAYIATRHCIGLDYARKKYADEPVGEVLDCPCP